MDLTDRLKHYKLNTSSSHPDVDFLKSVGVTSTVSRGFAELYKVQPKNPVTFLANWLMNESRSLEILLKAEEDKKVKAELEIVYKQRKEKADHVEKEKQKILQEEASKKHNFFKSIEICEDFDENTDKFCEELGKFVNATGVYVSIFDKKRKPVGPDDSDTGHLEDDKALRYVYHSDSHSFMKNLYLEPLTSETYTLINPKEDPVDINNADVNESKPIEDIKMVIVPEVLYQPSMKFFREPRLGCYYALDIGYNSSLNHESLTSAIEKYQEFRVKFDEREERKKQWELKQAEYKQEKEKLDSSSANIDDNNAVAIEDVGPFNEEEVILEEFKKTEIKLILSLDTLGQDRVFTEEENKFIIKTAKLIKSQMQLVEERNLIKDRDIRLNIENINKNLIEVYNQDKIEADEIAFVKSYIEQHQEGSLLSGKQLEELAKAKSILNYFNTDPLFVEVFDQFSKLHFVKNENLFQTIFYFMKYDNTIINEVDTNKLDWKKSNKLWTSDVIDYLGNYLPYGPKKEKINVFSLGNRLISSLEQLATKREEIRAESFILERILDFIILVLNIRKNDIIRRRDEISELKKAKEVAETNKREREEKRNKEIEDIRFKNSNLADDLNNNDENTDKTAELNEEELMKKWDEENQDYEIPPEIDYDEDNDFDLEYLKNII